MRAPLPRALAAEALGTFALVFFGPGAAVVQAQTGAPSHLGVAAVFGLTVAAVIAALAPISGAHIHPAATRPNCSARSRRRSCCWRCSAGKATSGSRFRPEAWARRSPSKRC